MSLPAIAARIPGTAIARAFAGDNNNSLSTFYQEQRLTYLDAFLFARSALLKRRCYASSKFLFIHVPRCAGTYASTLIHGKPLGHLYASTIRDWILGAEQFSLKESLAVARCPIERLVSAYCFSLQCGTNHVPQFPLYQPPRAALTSFPSFCRDWLFSQDLNRIDYIFRPQAWWVADREQKLIVDQIIDISELDGWLGSKGLQRPAPSVPAQRQRHNAVERDIFDSTMATIGNDLKVDILKFYACDVRMLSRFYKSEF